MLINQYCVYNLLDLKDYDGNQQGSKALLH